ncbi:triosephosphate isomerase [Magnetococcus marinus MC-1]|uniref:Triosephosphate isomerase n=1 Tax=Magnetococcus marinus (strain ATCC BAA-1437 / JCM 17883 / MC-1) TaxID=156889 RepID=TPIS_MAGMM|nr:triose-phosphate isomerase [Magnetococcus marinus]A0L8V0.1 RecName: Full=Triosephosphate isomerase; Short=TIM; Short=TPI; AltName: Full=Triose-phosphate isomerase [Magnetococcus marinus MC-1]ABK44393.1 triosephosphate isomerase [Magnetococcus marinus MC-1]
MRRALIAGNWKLNGTTQAATALATAVRDGVAANKPDCDVLVCPTFTVLSAVQGVVAGSGVDLGAQNMAVASSGAFTGEISGEMLKDVGCSYVILGHSERRTLFGETNEQVAQKVASAYRDGLTPILCVGETLEQREAEQTMQVLEQQLLACLPVLPADAAKQQQLVVAYEPVWAIGTGKVASTAQAQEAHAFIRGLLAKELGANVADAVRILYGGSMKPDNAKELLGQADVDGGLIGGAALKANDFLAIMDGLTA